MTWSDSYLTIPPLLLLGVQSRVDSARYMGETDCFPLVAGYLNVQCLYFFYDRALYIIIKPSWALGFSLNSDIILDVLFFKEA